MPNKERTEHAVVIAGAGPTGLMLAGELALARVDVAVVERRENHAVDGLRAGGLHMRLLEVLDQRGIAERFIAQGQKHQGSPFAKTTLDTSDVPTRHNYFLALWQPRIEATLATWIGELGVPIYRSCEVQSFEQDDAGVSVDLSDGRALRAQYLVGCDGGRSAVRKQAGIEFAGLDATTSYLITEMQLDQEPAWGMRQGKQGMDAAIGKLEGGGARAVIVEKTLGKKGRPTLPDIREALIGVFGTDFGLRSAAYISRFTDMTRQAAAYRKGRVFLAGDAAHVHSPMGGQGLNISMQDAVNLGWKLAQVVHRTAPDSLLDTYHAERHPVGARVLRNTMALTALERGDERVAAVRDVMTEMMQWQQGRHHYLAMMSGLDVHYDLGKGHPLLGRRIPDLDLTVGRLFTLLHEARPILLNFGEPHAFDDDITRWSDRVRLFDVEYTGAWELPVFGAVPAPKAVLVRPDGYVAWVGESGHAGLSEALTTWFGPSRA
jgi:2-polyprenyl-6-methoxyphenol hydroxylase-like FAD-dependent oxidoreductase